MRKFLRALWFAPRPAFPYPLPYGGWTWVYPDENGIALLRGYSSEEGVWKFLRNYIKPNMTCVDVGACQGFYTMLFLKQLRGTGRVYAFEPVRTQREQLHRNLRLNRMQEVGLTLSPLAVSDEVGNAQLYIVPQHESRSSLNRPPAEVQEGSSTLSIDARSIGTTSLDEYLIDLHEIERLDILKIDAEGAEYKILVGARRVLTDLRPVVVMEVADVTTREFGYPASRLVEFMENCGYSGYRVSSKGALTRVQKTEDSFRDTLLFLPSYRGQVQMYQDAVRQSV